MWVKEDIVDLWAAVRKYHKVQKWLVSLKSQIKVTVRFVPTEDRKGEWFHISACTGVASGSPWFRDDKPSPHDSQPFSLSPFSGSLLHLSVLQLSQIRVALDFILTWWPTKAWLPNRVILKAKLEISFEGLRNLRAKGPGCLSDSVFKIWQRSCTHSCLKKTYIMTAPIDMPTWTGQISQGSTLRWRAIGSQLLWRESFLQGWVPI